MKITFLTCCYLLTLAAFGQRDYSTSNKKAIKFYEKAETCLNYRDFDCAEEHFQKAIDKDDKFLEAYVYLSEVYGISGRYDKAIDVLKKMIALDPHSYPISFFFLGELEMKQELYQDARKHFSEFLKNESHPRPEMVIDAKQRIKNCDFAVEAMNNPVDFEPENMGPAINSEHPEYFPSITADNSFFLYTRRLPGAASSSGFNEDFFVSYQKNGEWNQCLNLSTPVNTGMNEGAPALSPDGQYLIFTACEEYGNYGDGRFGAGSCDLFVTRKSGNKWMAPVNLGKPVNTAHWESQPSFSSDGKTLYFIRGKKTREGIKDQDIYMTRLEKGGWSKPERLGNMINTPGREESVFIHPDGQTLYFSSDGHTGMGGLDIYLSRKDENGEWGDPLNLGYPINTSKDENSLLVAPDGKTAYFASDRDGGHGDLDIYHFELPEQLRPQMVTYMKGRVLDEITEKPLEAKFELIDLKTGQVMVESFSDEENGEFLISVPVNRNYALNVSKKGYLFHSESFRLSESGTVADPVKKDVRMNRFKAGEKVVLKNVFFDTDKYELKPESRVELDKLVTFLNNNPGLKIEIGGHTDNRGNTAANQVLSENRAESVYNYLIEHEISGDRLSFKGYGEDHPIASNDNEDGRALNRRTEFTVMEVQ